MEGKREGEVWNYTVNERPLEVEDFYIESIEAETTNINAYFTPIHRHVLFLLSSPAVLCRLLFFRAC